MTFEELLLQRRSVRNYKDKPVPKETIMSIIKESTYAPSSGNEQPWKFIIITNRELMNSISDEAKLNLLQRIASNPNDYAKKYENILKKENYNIFYNAPCLVFIVGDRHMKNTKINCTLAASYLMMSATAKNLATSWINFGIYISHNTQMQLGISDDYEIVAPIVIGYPMEISAIPHRDGPMILNVFE